jgi:hypothetical protein
LTRKQYLARQAATLLKFAQTTKDDSVAARLIRKAADLKEQVDGRTGDHSLQAPDVEPPPD